VVKDRERCNSHLLPSEQEVEDCERCNYHNQVDEVSANEAISDIRLENEI
jgi:DNA-directed RNA polymerase subunit M/transcription elongation factor TFIIS